jgi:hypothetical protein
MFREKIRIYLWNFTCEIVNNLQVNLVEEIENHHVISNYRQIRIPLIRRILLNGTLFNKVIPVEEEISHLRR